MRVPQKRVVQYWKEFGGEAVGRVAYVIQGRNCVFTGLDRIGASTINYVEDVIAAICGAEKRWEPYSLTYFDLQTHRGYRKLPGAYQFDRLNIDKLKGRLHVKSWAPAELMKDEAEIFAEEIGDPASWFRVLTPQKAETFGFSIWLASFNGKATALAAAAEQTRSSVNHEVVYTVVSNSGSRPHLKASRGRKYTLWIESIFSDKLIHLPEA